MSGTELYTPGFYAEGREGCRRSSSAIVPMLADLFKPRRVVDVGCGEGWFAKAFEGSCPGWAVGLDGEYVEPVCKDFRVTDLREPIIFPALHYFDLALCLEVAEHLPESRAESLVADLCKLAPTVVFSAAIPGQTGTDHINCQWPSYWAELFAGHGYEGTGVLRRRIWNDRSIESWYRQNLLVFGDLGPLEPDGCPDLVHPEIWAWKL